MIVVENKKKYYNSILQYSFLLLAGFVVVQLFRPSHFLISIVIFAIIEFILLSTKFTEAVVVNDTSLKIVYRTFLVKREIDIKIDEVQFKLSKTGSFRSPTYLVLDILQKNRRVYRIDSRDGFTEDDLLKIQGSLMSS